MPIIKGPQHVCTPKRGTSWRRAAPFTHQCGRARHPEQIANSMWTGYISSSLITLVANAMGSRKSATKIVKAMSNIATDLQVQLWDERNKIQKANRKKRSNPEWTIDGKIRALYGAELGHITPTKQTRSTRRKTAVRLTLPEFLALPAAIKERRYANIMAQLEIETQGRVPLVGDHYRSYQVTEEEVIFTEGTITGTTGDKTHPYKVTCTGADNRGYIGKTVAVPAKTVDRRITHEKHKLTDEEKELLNCEVRTDFKEMGIHKGYVADAGYDSEEGETLIDIIYEDQDIRTVSITEAFQQRELKPKGSTNDLTEAFELRKIRLKPRKRGLWGKQHRTKETITVSPKGQSIQLAVKEIHNRSKGERNTRARAAEGKAARKKDIEQKRAAHEGKERTAFTEPSIFAYRAMSTGRRRQSERVAPGLGPGPVGGVTER